jgi:hypothetical protein
MDQEGNPLPPPYRLVNNDFLLLDETDLVFIDPVSTGYSRVTTGQKAKELHSFTKDIESVGEFIRLYVTRQQGVCPGLLHACLDAERRPPAQLSDIHGTAELKDHFTGQTVLDAQPQYANDRDPRTTRMTPSWLLIMTLLPNSSRP